MGVKSKVKTAVKIFVPPGTKRFYIIRKTLQSVGLVRSIPDDVNYAEWVERTEPFTWSPQIELSYKPLISIVVPVFNPPEKYFLPMVYSVINQTYQNWQLVLVDASTDPKASVFTQATEAIDDRIKVVKLSSNKGIAGNTNAGLKACEGDYVVLLDHDDTIASEALYEIVLTMQGEVKPDFVYSDEDKLNAKGEFRFDPHFKPDWSPQLLRELNYLNHLTVIKKTLLDKVGGYRSGFDGAQDFDLYLRIVDEKPVITHIPKVLYHWRAAETSTAQDFSTKDNILEAGIGALSDHLKRNGQEGKVTAVKKQPGFYKISYTPKDDKVAVFVLPSAVKGQYDRLVEQLAASVKGAHLHVELYAQPAYDKPSTVPKNVTVTHLDETTNHGFIEAALKLTTSKAVVVVGSAIAPLSKHWLSELAGVVSQVKSVGLVNPLIVGADSKTIIDAGLVKSGSASIQLFLGLQEGNHTYLGNTDWVRNIDSITGRCFAARTSTLDAFIKDASRKSDLWATLSSYVTKKELEIVLWPFVKLEYAGDLSPSLTGSGYFNPNVTLVRQDFSVPKTINVPAMKEIDE